MYLPDATIYFQRLHLAFVFPVQVRQGTQPGEKVVLRGKGWSLWFHLRQTPLSEITLSITHTFPLFFCRNKGEKFFVVWESLCSLQHQSPNVCLFASRPISSSTKEKRIEEKKNELSKLAFYFVCALAGSWHHGNGSWWRSSIKRRATMWRELLLPLDEISALLIHRLLAHIISQIALLEGCIPHACL
jgi:hypothetical protein